MITVRSTINLAHQSVPEVIPAVQGDTGRSILFSLADFTIPTGATARYFITKPSGLAVYNDATIDGNTVLVDLTAQSLAEYGDCPGQVRISVGDTVVTSFEFILHVEPFRGIDAVESTTETNIFDKAVDDAREAIAEAAEDAEEYISQALDTTLTIPDKAADAKATGDAIRYGAYPFLTAGQLLSIHETTDNTPYNYRVVEQESTLEYGEIVGGTVAFNQLVQNGNFAENTGWEGRYGTLSIADGVATMTPTSSGTARGLKSTTDVAVYAMHKYLMHSEILAPIASGVGMAVAGGGTVVAEKITVANAWTSIDEIWTIDTDVTAPIFALILSTLTTSQTVKYKNVIVTDLTQMLGTTLADYIYGLESATAGTGVAWLKKHFPKMFTYHAYDAGSLVSVEGLSAHKTTGFNQWDEQWEVGAYSNSGEPVSSTIQIRSKNYIPVLPSTTYYMVASAGNRICFYDASKAFISVTFDKQNTTFTTPANCNYVRFNMGDAYGTTYNHDICINISDPSRNGEYRPYASHTYPLDDSLTLRGIYKLDSSNRLYADGDVYKPDGTVQRRYGAVVINEDTPISAGSYYGMLFRTNNMMTDKKRMVHTNDSPNGMTDRLVGVKQSDTWGTPFTFSFTTNSDDMYFKLSDNITTTEDAKTYLANNPITLLYELATPTTETADPYTNPQIVAPGGTEEYISTSVVPVGHESRYPDDLRAKLDALPWDLSMIAPIENGTTASQAYAVGKYFMHNNQFCKAKTAIASGATLTLNTNYEVTTIADELYSALH